MKRLVFEILGALMILFMLWLWHEKDKEVDALSKDLEVAHSTINAKNQEAIREDAATVKRDKEYEQQNKKLDAIQRNLRAMAADSKEVRDLLNLRIPPALLRELQSYNDKHEAESAGAPTPKTGNRK